MQAMDEDQLQVNFRRTKSTTRSHFRPRSPAPLCMRCGGPGGAALDADAAALGVVYCDHCWAYMKVDAIWIPRPQDGDHVPDCFRCDCDQGHLKFDCDTCTLCECAFCVARFRVQWYDQWRLDPSIPFQCLVCERKTMQ